MIQDATKEDEVLMEPSVEAAAAVQFERDDGELV